jgi:hypothetical protein
MIQSSDFGNAWSSCVTLSLKTDAVCHETVHTTFELMMLVDSGVQIAFQTPAELPQRCYFSQIQAHTNYTLLEGQPFCQTMVYAFIARWLW